MNQHTFSSHENCYTFEVALTDDYHVIGECSEEIISFICILPYIIAGISRIELDILDFVPEITKYLYS